MTQIEVAPSDALERLLKVGEAAKALGISHVKVYELIKTGELESLKIGAARRITRQAVLDYIQRQVEAERAQRADVDQNEA